MRELSIAIAFLLMAPALSSAGGVIYGKVLDQNNNPVPGATVRLDEMRTETLTDGSYYFKGVRSGIRYLKITYGSKTWSETLEIVPNFGSHVSYIEIPSNLPFSNTWGNPNEVVRSPYFIRKGSATPYDSTVALEVANGGKFDLIMLDPRDGAKSKLVATEENDSNPSWSSNLNLVYQTDSKEHGSRIWLETGSGAQFIDYGASPKWSSDGSAIIYTKVVDGMSKIYLRKTPKWYKFFSFGRELSAGGDERDPYEAAVSGVPTIFFSSTRTGHREIWSMNRRGLNAVSLTAIAADTGHELRNPSVTADGSVLIFWEDAETPRIWIARPDGTGARVAVENAHHPTWAGSSDDGYTLVFTSEFGGSSQVWTTTIPKELN